jgi:hypothetical protein
MQQLFQELLPGPREVAAVPLLLLVGSCQPKELEEVGREELSPETPPQS